jgi:hypothetical protein
MTTLAQVREAIDTVQRGGPIDNAIAIVGQEHNMAPREDKTAEELSAEFAAQAKVIALSYPYVDNAWIAKIAMDLKNGADAKEVQASAEQNRGQYTDEAKIDAGGSWSTWETVCRALMAAYDPPKA